MLRIHRSSFIAVAALAAVLTVGAGACDKKKDGAPAGKQAPAAPPAASGAPPASGAPAAHAPGTPAPAAPAPAAPAAAAASGSVDHSDPVKLTEAIFAAAASGKIDTLKGLCDPAGSGDGDVKDICGVTAGGEKYGEFKEYFAKGKVKGAARIEGDNAEVDILFGPDGSKDETMKLARVGGQWYLASF